MISLKTITLAMLLALATLSIAPAIAAGGGSPGGVPSSSAPRFNPVEEYQKGVSHLQNKKYKKAIKAFKQVLSVARKDANTNYMLGLAYIGQQKLKKARRPLEKALKYDDQNIDARGHLGAVYLALGKMEKAEQQKNILLGLQSNCQSCSAAANIQTALKRIELRENHEHGAPQAQQQFNLPKIESVNADRAYVNAVEDINRGDYTAALNSLRESARVFGPHPDILTYQGFANRKLGNYQTALKFYQVALSVAPEHRGANEYLGEYYVELGELPSAHRQLAKLDAICDFSCEESEELRRWIDTAES